MHWVTVVGYRQTGITSLNDLVIVDPYSGAVIVGNYCTATERVGIRDVIGLKFNSVYTVKE